MSIFAPMARRPTVAAVCFLAAVGAGAVADSTTGESTSESARALDRLSAHARFPSPCDQPVIVLRPESVVFPREMNNVLRERGWQVADLPVDVERRLVLLRVEPADPSLWMRLRDALRSVRTRVAVEDRNGAVSPAAFASDAEACRQ
jgi:hypothetical protein